MKIGVISDIHIDEQKDEMEFEEIFAQCINESEADVILIAGDISEYYKRSLNFIKRLRGKIHAGIYFCPGNHDLWSKYEPEIHADDITACMREEDEGFLQNDAVFLTENTVLISGCGWYDYSFSSPGMFTVEEMRRKNYMGRQWRDGIYASHGKNDEDVNSEWNSGLLKLVNDYKDYNVIFMTHMVNHPAFLVSENHEKYKMFQYFNGFLGSQGLYEITKKRNIKYAISGHVHFRKNVTENGTCYMCRCLGYPDEFKLFGAALDLKSQIDNSFGFIRL